jgi:MATE family multidrug resistance protein
VEVAAHQVAINLASLTFMVPLAVGAAAAVTVGHAVGAGDLRAARRAAVAAMLCGTGFMCGSALLFLAVPGALARLYTTDAAVVALAAALIPIAGVFQVADGLQAVAAGVLRGAADTRMPLVLNLLGFWLLGMPVSLYLAFRTDAGPRGLWWGLVVGLGAVALLLLARMRRRFGGTLRRVVIDDLGATPVVLETSD